LKIPRGANFRDADIINIGMQLYEESKRDESGIA
jgi:hypothetical protein